MTDLDNQRCRLTMDIDNFEWPTHIVLNLDAPFQVIEPHDFEQHLAAIAARLGQNEHFGV